MEEDEYNHITPARVIKILQRHGTVVTEEQAEGIIEFMGRLARMEVTHFLLDEEIPQIGVNTLKSKRA